MNQDLCEESTTHVQKLVNVQTTDDSERSTFVGGHDLKDGVGSGSSLAGGAGTTMAGRKATGKRPRSSRAVLKQDVAKGSKKGEKTSIFEGMSNVQPVANFTPAWLAQSGLLSLVQTEDTSSSSELSSSAKSSLLVATSSSVDQSSLVETFSSTKPSSSVDPSSFAEILSAKKETRGTQASISPSSGSRKSSLKMSSVVRSSSSLPPMPLSGNTKTDILTGITEHAREPASAGESKPSDKTLSRPSVPAGSSTRPSSQQSVTRMTPRPRSVYTWINPELRQKHYQGSSTSGVVRGGAGHPRHPRPRSVYSWVNPNLRQAQVSAAPGFKSVSQQVSNRSSPPLSCSNTSRIPKTSSPPSLHPDSNSTALGHVGRQEKSTQLQDRQFFAPLPIVTVSRMPPMPKFWEFKPLEFSEVIVVHAESPTSFVAIPAEMKASLGKMEKELEENFLSPQPRVTCLSQETLYAIKKKGVYHRAVFMQRLSQGGVGL
ncbi:cell wall protein RBR3-like isoform X3 [Aplysia californica]|uniref:Cell wall protein RBR3-like isoform X3 n=1 Tax=Aplysia californica TaxID=6500 RepID=A0ABM1A744_APLCA|nr:cell wall protein RBR3-like isoform X3 [Aplysia californica]